MLNFCYFIFDFRYIMITSQLNICKRALYRPFYPQQLFPHFLIIQLSRTPIIPGKALFPTSQGLILSSFITSVMLVYTNLLVNVSLIPRLPHQSLHYCKNRKLSFIVRTDITNPHLIRLQEDF